MYMETFFSTWFARSLATRILALIVAGLALSGIQSPLYAFGLNPDLGTNMVPAGVKGRATFGWVMARSMVRDENGQPILVEYDDQGDEVSELAVPAQYKTRIDELRVVAAANYRDHLDRYETFVQDHPDLAVTLVRRAQAIGTFPLADDSKHVTIREGHLRSSTRSVLMADRPSRLLAKPQVVILQEYPFDLTQSAAGILGARSLLVNDEGQVITTSRYIIAPRAGFYGQNKQGGQGGSLGYRFDPETDELYGPVENAYINMNEFVHPEARTASNADGYYRLQYRLPPCPPGGFTFNTDVWAKIHYANFSPLGQTALPYYLRRLSSEYCYGAINPVTGQLMENPAVNSVARMDFFVDVMFLTGRLVVTNPDGSSVPVGTETRYEVFDPESTDDASPTPWYDFDNDGQADHAVIGRMVDDPDDAADELVFVEDADGDIQGIYFSSSDEQTTPDGETPEPDLVRQLDADRQQRLEESTGLLTSISQGDLQNTDILVFRAATGELVLERRGLRDEETHVGEVDVGDDGTAGYRLMLRGLQDSNLNIGGAGFRGNSYEQWASDYQLTEPFRSRDAFHLQPGEWVEIVAINRTTGYTGTARAQLESVSDDAQNGLSVAVDPIKLSPPNLKVWAERDYNIDKGLSAGDDRDGNIIGAEGAGLQSDKKIVVYTEWLAADGSALPEGLAAIGGAQYGLTGRLAKVVGTDTLQAAGFHSEQAEFPIGPGRQTQILQLNDGLSNPEHYYIHVIGRAKNQEACTGGSCADFDYLGSDVGVSAPLDTRPRYIAPILTPHYDEEQHWLAYREYRRLLKAGEDPDNATPPDTGVDPTRPVPTYTWNHRPEYQFSRYSLEIDEINRVDVDPDTGAETKDDIYDSDTPVIGSSDDLVEVLYSLIGPEFERLAPIDGRQDLVLAIGEHETKVELGEDKTLKFDNIDHLAGLAPEDFLSMRLYLNQDAGNILWEYAFWSLNADVADDDLLKGSDIYYVNADEPTVDLVANLMGYSILNDDIKAKAPQRIYWRVTSGNASLNPSSADIDESGSVKTTLRLNPYSNNIAYVEAFLIDGAGSATKPITIGVVPGKPKNISVTSTGKAYLKGNGSVQLEATVRDKNNNLVTNGTGVRIREHGHVNLETSTGITDQGKVQATLTGGSIAGSYQVDVLSGEAIASTNVTVAPLSVEVNGISASLDPGQVYQLTAKVSGGSGSLKGIFLDLGTNGGMISNRELVTDSKGELQFSYRAPTQPGLYNLGVKLDLNDPQVFDLPVGSATASSPIAQEREYLVTGTAENNGSITNFRGQTATVGYPLQSEITLKGIAGNDWSLSVSDPHLPNVEPIYFSRFNDIFWDTTRQYPSSGENVYTTASLHDGLYAISQDQDTVVKPWEIDRSNDFVISNPSYNFWLNLGTSGKVISIANDSIELSYSGGVLQASAQSLDEDSIKQTSVASVSGVSENQWYAVAIRIENGSLTLAVDQQKTTTPLVGNSLNYNSVTADSPWLSLGDDFTGRVAGLRIYDLDKSPLVQLAQSSGVFDAQGSATTTVQLTTPATQADIDLASVTVGLIDGAGNVSTMNILSKKTLDNMALAMHSVSSGSSLSADDVIQKMPLHQYFPDPKAGVSNFVSSFALRSHATASVENVLANLSWMKLNSKYPSLHDDVETLQSYFADIQHPDLAHYGTEYLQEATVQASYGNNFWLRAMATSFKVWAEMASGHPDEASQIARAIRNRGDFWAWVRLLSIPANGWATDSIPVPRPDITCDKVTPTVNAGTPLAFSLEPCRVSGVQMASLVKTITAIDPAVVDEPELLTTYATYLLSSVREMPLEYKQWFTNESNFAAWDLDSDVIPQAHAAAPLVAYPVRAFLVLIKQSLRKAGGGAPANFVAFMQGGTTSRVEAATFLPAIAYLASRFNDAPDELCGADCVRMNKQVSDTVKEDIAAWFVSMGLSKKGDIADRSSKSKSCTIAHANHGKAFELLGTAMYHALYEFGDKVGVDNEKYKILLSDPRKEEDIINVGLMVKENNSDRLVPFNSPRQRKPDLVLFGDGPGETTWVEFKSWGYFPKTFKKREPWNGVSKAGSAQYTDASRQYFLDFAASQDALQVDYWDKQSEETQEAKPSDHKTWFQMWEEGSRRWRALVKKNGKYQFENQWTYRSVSRPWISSKDLIKSSDLGKGKPFQELQKFLAGVSPDLKNDVYEATIGKQKENHEANFVEKQVTTSFSDLVKSNIRPFNIPTFLALELGDESGDRVSEVLNTLLRELGDGKFVELQEAVNNKKLTKEQIDDLRDTLTEEMEAILGPWAWLLVDIPLLSWAENKVADWVLGEEVEELRKAVAEYDMPEDFFENICEDQ